MVANLLNHSSLAFLSAAFTFTARIILNSLRARTVAPMGAILAAISFNFEVNQGLTQHIAHNHLSRIFSPTNTVYLATQIRIDKPSLLRWVQ